MPFCRGVLTFALLSLATGALSLSAAQEASIIGTVTDRSGGHVVNARVDLTGPEGTRTALTGPDGGYRFHLLPSGQYILTVAVPGFRTVQHDPLQVGLGDVLTVPVRLEPSGVAEQVQVRPQRRGTPSSLSLTADDLEARPGGRDPAGLVTMVPGVVFERLDAAGAESVSPSQFIYRGTRGLDAAWTIDGIVVTDRQTGRAPGYYDVDSLSEVQFSPASHDIARPGSGLGVNLVFRTGTDHLRATARGFFTQAAWQGRRPSPLSDHTQQVHEFGADVGGPLARGRAWFWVSASQRASRVHRLASGAERADVTPVSAKVNWQASQVDRLSLLWLDHPERRYGINPSPLPASADALQDQSTLYPDSPLRGLWKIENARAIGPLSLSARYAYYATGFQLMSRGTGSAGVSELAGRTIGATVSSWSTRPQHTLAADATLFRMTGRIGHQLRLGSGWQQVEMQNGSSWPGLGVVGIEYSDADRRARIHRDTASHSRLVFGHAYAGDSIAVDRLTIDAGVRVDYQRGELLPGRAAGNPAFPVLMPGIEVAGASTRSWIDLSPRASARYAIRSGGTLALRVSAGRFASQQVMAAVVQTNPANVSAWIEYPWEDLNGDRLAQPLEVRTDGPYLAFEGFNPQDPGSPVSPVSLDPDLSSRIASTASIGIDAEFGRTTSASLSYHYARHSDWPVLRWAGLAASDYIFAGYASAMLPDGTTAEVPIHVPDARVIQANGARRVLFSDPGFYSTYRGLELTVARRMSQGWSLAVTGAWNDSRAFYRESPRTNGLGNPTRLDGSTSGGQLTAPRDPLVPGGQIAPFTQPLTAGGRTFLNARWHVSAAATARLPWAIEVAGAVVGREGNPSPYVVRQGLGLDGNRTVLMTPTIDTIRLPDLWNVDARLSRNVRIGAARVQMIGDVFNVLNADTPLVKDRNLRSLNFDRVTMRVSPRILRLGLRISY